MKPKTLVITLVVLVILVIGLSASMYVVEEGTQVVVTQFGRPVNEVTEAGLHFKTPFIQKVHYLEKRLLPWDGAPESMQTNDKKRIDIDGWARRRIVEHSSWRETAAQTLALYQEVVARRRS